MPVFMEYVPYCVSVAGLEDQSTGLNYTSKATLQCRWFVHHLYGKAHVSDLFSVSSECNLVLNTVFVPGLIIHYNGPVDVHLSGASFKQTNWEEDNGARLTSSVLQTHGYSINWQSCEVKNAISKYKGKQLNQLKQCLVVVFCPSACD